MDGVQGSQTEMAWVQRGQHRKCDSLSHVSSGMERSVQNSGPEGTWNPLALFATFAIFVEMVILIVRGENKKTSLFRS